MIVIVKCYFIIKLHNETKISVECQFEFPLLKITHDWKNIIELDVFILNSLKTLILYMLINEVQILI